MRNLRRLAGCGLTLLLVFSLAGAALPAGPARAATVHAVGVCKTSSSALNIRAGANTTSRVVGKLAKGAYIQVAGTSGKFYKVKYDMNGSVGYCSKTYLKIASSAYGVVKTQSSALNVRASASTSARVIKTLKKGSVYPVVGKSGKFYRIMLGGTSGYVSKDYFKVTGKVGTTSGNAGGSSVTGTGSSGSSGGGSGAVSQTKPRLNVPLYKQTDKRWANVKLGKSGKTMGDVGCVVTGLAMIRSYKTGTSVTPDKMAKTMSFTASGAAYWPGDTVSDYSSDYLSNIYKQLKKNNPVLFGSKTKSGNQHWVVVTGYTGSGKQLKASDFTVNDSMYNSKTLAQHLQKRPVFYKIVYY